jgi:hypothetical protein
MDHAHIFEAAGRFHGHIGPWLALGVRAGLLARNRLRACQFELVADVYCPDRTPYTCFLDGVQFSAGCTMGKGNIHHHPAEGCRAVFSATAGAAPGQELTLEIAPALWSELHQHDGLTPQQVALLGYDVFGRPPATLFINAPTGGNCETRGRGPESNEP